MSAITVMLSALKRKHCPPSPESASSAVTANIADPKLVEIAQIEAQSDCYKDAEVTARRRLVRLQAAVKDSR